MIIKIDFYLIKMCFHIINIISIGVLIMIVNKLCVGNCIEKIDGYLSFMGYKFIRGNNRFICNDPRFEIKFESSILQIYAL